MKKGIKFDVEKNDWGLLPFEQVNYISRDEAKEQAIYKAFEILEDKK